LKILLFTNNFLDTSRGGVEFHVAALAQGLTKLGHSVTIVRTSDQEPVHTMNEFDLLVPLRKSDDTFNRRLGDNLGPRSLRMIFNFYRRVSNGRRMAKWITGNMEFINTFDLVHHHDFVTSYFVSRKIAQNSPIRQFWTNHLGEFLLINKIPILGNQITRLLSRNYVHAFAPSSELANQGGISCPVDMVPNGADLDLFHPLNGKIRHTVRKSLGWNSDFVVIVPRRWAPPKGVIYAAQAARELANVNDLRFVFVGAMESEFPEYAKNVRKFLDQTEGKVTVIDSASQVKMSELLASSDITLIPSLLEAVSLSAVESLATGTPIIASDVGGLPEVVHPRKTGFLVQPKSESQIVEAIRAAMRLKETGELITMGSYGRRLVEANYSWETIVSRFEAAYAKE
jgi:glycosyltransferase involved in cell wall biosynthesis